jgi:heat shock protein HslJ
MNDGLTGTWRVIALLPGAQAPSQPTTITFEDGRLYFYAGCNRAVGAYTVSSDTLRAGPVALTMMYCPDMTVEQHLCTALAEPLQLDLRDDLLVVSGPRGGFQARREEPEP